ncbi:IBR finger domain-containing protein [Teratosphaeria destructans]|uniref:IBR finger domain-containing protein n=1 Tax=Teratosphaeria destructans TaxID=418781 RepID=A0A9W7SUP9_9PEZI|nr:IBR finger domain-containing protein [Teratosphaeria destructans]
MALWEGGFRDMDPLTMSAIVQMQLDDIEQLKTNHKGKQREGTVTDAQLALQMYNEDLRACDHTLKDRQMAQSLCLAVLRDGDLIRRAYEEEQQANRDHELAMRLSRNELPRVIPRKRAQSRDSDPWSDDEELLYKAAATYMHRPASVQGMRLSGLADDTEDTTMAESSTWAAARKASDKPLMRRCASCFEEKEFFDVARVPCNDEYCRPCLAQLFELSMKDESLYPPKCHGQVIPVSRVSFFLPQRLVKEFQRKAPELDCKDRTYCHGRSCSTFIPPAAISNDIGKCPRCQKTTCTMCKGPSHLGDCPEDTALQKLAETADQKQWQRCFSCKRFVELRYGCNHIRYVASKPWKSRYLLISQLSLWSTILLCMRNEMAYMWLRHLGRASLDESGCRNH